MSARQPEEVAGHPGPGMERVDRLRLDEHLALQIDAALSEHQRPTTTHGTGGKARLPSRHAMRPIGLIVGSGLIGFNSRPLPHTTVAVRGGVHVLRRPRRR